MAVVEALSIGNGPGAVAEKQIGALAVIVCVIFGLIGGIWTAAGSRRSTVAELIPDTVQTFRSFINLDPASMLFRAQDFAAVVAVAMYVAIRTLV